MSAPAASPTSRQLGPGKTLEDTIAQAIAAAFWETAETPKSWAAMSWQERQVFQLCAKRAIEAGRAFKSSRTPQADKTGPGRGNNNDFNSSREKPMTGGVE
jgi:hypothetical protein